MAQIILAEKPAAGVRIKDALEKNTISATGHLMVLDAKAKKWTPPYFDLEWMVADNAKGKILTKVVKKLQVADLIYIATDYDREGQLIASYILREAGIPTSDVFRMKFSSLERDELISAYNNPIAFDDKLAIEAEVRHHLDWYFGKNLSKALTQKLKPSGSSQRKFYSTPVGRVQTPVLYYLVAREREIIKFIDKDVWKVDIYGAYGDKFFFRIGHMVFEELLDAEAFMEVTEGSIERIEEVQRQRIYLPPNKDFVVKECLKKGIPTDIVDRNLQDLYLDGYISYPRTVSEKYTGVDTQKYLLRMAEAFPEAKKALGQEPREGSMEGVHPAIYPIEPYTESDMGGLIFKIILESFIKCHLPPETWVDKTTYVSIGDGWHISTENPNLSEGDEFDLRYVLEKTKNRPPWRLKPNQVYEWMVEQNLGTVDTRSVILHEITGKQKGYAYEADEGLWATGKGMRIVDTLTKIYPAIIGVDLTRTFEGYIESVRNGELSRDEVLLKGRDTVTEIVEKIRRTEL